jgi:FkbM family methyltransferase
MLFSFEEINKILQEKKIKITGAFHIGAHKCEELEFYNKLGLNNESVIWIEALPFLCQEAADGGIPNVFNGVVSDKDDEIVEFNISNNLQSSSLLEFGTHLQEHPEIEFISKFLATTITVDSFFVRVKLDASKYNFWNFDIQGVELLALKGAKESIKFAKAIYLEVNESKLYINGALIDEIDSFLAELKFKRVLTRITINTWGDALYIRDI